MADEIKRRSDVPEIGDITIADILASLKAGWHDFKRAPIFGIFFSAFYVLCGFVLILLGADTFTWTLVLSLGFPLVTPFAAVGLYEVSRRLESDEPLVWSEILGAVWLERGGQVPWIGVILLIIFLFWSFFAHMSLALFLGNMSLTNISTSWEVFGTLNGRLLILFEFLVGGAVALLTFALTVVAIPLLLEHELDFVTAMLLSAKTFLRNKRVLSIWAGLIAVMLFVGMIPMFLGLFLVLPVLGHATWHLYRRALYAPL